MVSPTKVAPQEVTPKVVAVVPTFHPGDDVPKRLAALNRQVNSLIVVDDGSDPAFALVLNQIAATGITIIQLPSNCGIATALNTGIRQALSEEAAFVLTVDQDSDLPANYVAVALAVFAAATTVTQLGMVCVDAVNGTPALPPWTSPEGLALVPEAIQTGLMISRECLEKIGLMDERLVIDCVDTEYCLRARNFGFRIAVAVGTDIAHRIGERVALRPFGFPITDTAGESVKYQYHSPLRRYYIARNNLDLVFRNLRKRPKWALRVLKRELRGMTYSMVSGPKRLAQILAITTGTLHGFFRRRGMIPNWLKRIIT